MKNFTEQQERVAAMANDKTTAHQLWCNQIQAQLEAILWPKRIQTGKHLIQMPKPEVRKQAELVIETVVTFENTRLRVVVDEIIAKLDASTAQLNSLHDEFKATKRWEFRKRSKIRIELHRAEAIRDAYQQSVLIVVNTKPLEAQPEIKSYINGGPVEPIVKPQMSVN